MTTRGNEKTILDIGDVRLLIERIHARTEAKASGCLEWNSKATGYPVLNVGGKVRYVAQLVWEIENQRPFPEGSRLLRTCRNQKCVEVSHLEVVDRTQQMKDIGKSIPGRCIPIKDRLRKGSRQEGSCRIWIPATREKPEFYLKIDNKRIHVRRLAWEQKHPGELDKNVLLFNQCGNPACIEPSHQQAETRQSMPGKYMPVAKTGTSKEQYQRLFDLGPLSACWPWKGPVNNGYGFFTVDGKRVRAHRYGYEVVFGQLIEEGYELGNLCGLRSCQNPNHWEPRRRYVSLERASEPYRAVGPRKLEERDVIRQALLGGYDGSRRRLATQLGVATSLIAQTERELEQEGLLELEGVRGIALDGRSCLRRRRDLSHEREKITQELTKCPVLTSHSLADEYEVSVGVVVRIRKDLPHLGYRIGRNGQVFPQVDKTNADPSAPLEASAMPDETPPEVTRPIQQSVRTCAWIKPDGVQCKGRPWREYSFCHQHLEHRQLTPIEEVQLQSAEVMLARLEQGIFDELLSQVGAVRSDSNTAQARAFAASVVQDCRRRLRKSPALAENLAAEGLPEHVVEARLSGWITDLTARVSASLRKALHLAAPSIVAVRSTLPSVLAFQANPVLVAVVDGLCHVQQWTETPEFKKGRNVLVGRQQLQIGLHSAAVEEHLPTLAAVAEFALKIHYALWAHYYMQTQGHPGHWARLSIEQLCEDLGYTRRESGKFRSLHLKQVELVVGALGHLYVRGEPAANQASAGVQPVWKMTIRSTGDLERPHRTTAPESREVIFTPGGGFTRQADLSPGKMRKNFLALRGNKDPVAIRIAAYLAAIARFSRNKGNTGSISVSQLLERVGLDGKYGKNPGMLREVLIEAFDTLSDREGILADWSPPDWDEVGRRDLGRLVIHFRWPA